MIPLTVSSKWILVLVFLYATLWGASQGIVFDHDSEDSTTSTDFVTQQLVTPSLEAKTIPKFKRQTVRDRKTNPKSYVRNELFEAAYIADVDRVRHLLQLDSEVLTSRPPVLPDRVDEDEGRSALLVCGLDPQSPNRTQVDNDCATIAQLLHNAGADMFLVDKHGWDALAIGAVRGYSRFCKYLLKHAKVDPNRVDRQNVTALMKAAGHAHFGVVHVLLRYGADLKMQDYKGSTALHYATRLALMNDSYIPFLKKVVKNIPQHLVDVHDSNNRTCLMYATINNNLPIARLFLQWGADPRLQDSFYVSIPTMTTDEELRKELMEAIANRVESEHAQWLKAQIVDAEFEEDGKLDHVENMEVLHPDDSEF